MGQVEGVLSQIALSVGQFEVVLSQIDYEEECVGGGVAISGTVKGCKGILQYL